VKVQGQPYSSALGSGSTGSFARFLSMKMSNFTLLQSVLRKTGVIRVNGQVRSPDVASCPDGDISDLGVASHLPNVTRCKQSLTQNLKQFRIDR
jgi:hypothetical protein